MAVHCDVTDEAAVAEAFRTVVLAYGGVDVVVSNAGIALSAPIDDTTLRDWTRTMDVLATGYFLISREAFRLWKDQRMGGSLIFVTSKNSVVARRNAAAYNTAKAAELHLARSLAEEGGPIGVRVNSVLPDAVLQDSGIWDAGWRQARAAAYGIRPEELDEYYRQRTVLKVNVLPAPGGGGGSAYSMASRPSARVVWPGAPRYARRTRPSRMSWPAPHCAVLEGMAKQIPCDPMITAVLTPTTCPRKSTSGPPEFPGFSAASVWMMFSMSRPVCARSVRPTALTTPVVTVAWNPRGLPMAITS